MQALSALRGLMTIMRAVVAIVAGKSDASVIPIKQAKTLTFENTYDHVLLRPDHGFCAGDQLRGIFLRPLDPFIGAAANGE
jgi:hypothetical protein